MGKIYRRPTQLGGTPKRKKNEKNRVRNTIMNFRVSPDEKKLIEARISATGMTKAEFFIQSCLYQKILVRGNIRSFTEIDHKLAEIAATVSAVPDLTDLDLEQAQILKTILEIVDRRFGREKKDGNEKL